MQRPIKFCDRDLGKFCLSSELTIFSERATMSLRSRNPISTGCLTTVRNPTIYEHTIARPSGRYIASYELERTIFSLKQKGIHL